MERRGLGNGSFFPSLVANATALARALDAMKPANSTLFGPLSTDVNGRKSGALEARGMDMDLDTFLAVVDRADDALGKGTEFFETLRNETSALAAKSGDKTQFETLFANTTGSGYHAMEQRLYDSTPSRTAGTSWTSAASSRQRSRT